MAGARNPNASNYQEAFRDLDRSLRDFAKSGKGERKGRRPPGSRDSRRPGGAIGADLAVKAVLTGGDEAGNVVAVDGPKAPRASLRRLRRASRAHSGKAEGSANRREVAARPARIHARVASARADALHKATTSLASRYGTVVAEDLNVAGMTRNRPSPPVGRRGKTPVEGL